METLLLLVFITAVIEVLIGFVLIALYGEKGQKMRAMELEMLLEARSKPNIQGEQRKQLEQRIEKLRKPVHFLHYAGLGLTLFGGIGLAVSLLSYALLAYAL
jgi:hypothetical protein